MKLEVHAPFALAMTAMTAMASALFACGDDEPAPAAGSLEDAGLEIDSGRANDASGGDAERDASVDAPGDAAKKICSDEGWCHTDVPFGQVLRDVWSDGVGGAWAISDQGAVLRKDGSVWTIQHTYTAANPKLSSLWGSGPTDLWIGAQRAILHGTGATPASLVWTERTLDDLTPDAGAVSIYGTSSGDIFAAAGTSVLHYAGEASGWIVDPVTTSIAGQAIEVWGRAGAPDVWITTVQTSTKKSILFHRAGPDGSAWQAVEGVSEVPFNISTRRCNTPGEPRRGWMVDDSTVWLIGTRINFNLVCHYLFHGASESGAPFAFDGSVLYDAYFRQNDIWGSSPSDVWLAGDFGALSHWDGTTWQLAGITVDEQPVKRNLNAIFGRGPSDIWVVGDGIALHKGAL